MFYRKGFFFVPFNSAGLLQRFHLLVFFLPTGKWEFPGLTSLNPHDIQSQILEAAKILILTSLPVGFLPDARNGCFESQLFQPGKKKKKVPEGAALVLPGTLLLSYYRHQARYSAHEKGLQQKEAKAEHIRLDQNQGLLRPSAKKAVFIFHSGSLRLHLRYTLREISLSSWRRNRIIRFFFCHM